MLIFGVTSVSTTFTTMASTFWAMKFCTWESCLPMSFWASSNCTLTSFWLAAWLFMLLRTTVRKLSSKADMVTPILAAEAGMAAAVRDRKTREPANLVMRFIGVSPCCVGRCHGQRCCAVSHANPYG
ncbi:hypothetical protein QF022_001689 [Vogesella perlucida]|nr:hypothetical protein [Vogesella perlucida]